MAGQNLNERFFYGLISINQKFRIYRLNGKVYIDDELKCMSRPIFTTQGKVVADALYYVRMYVTVGFLS